MRPNTADYLKCNPPTNYDLQTTAWGSTGLAYPSNGVPHDPPYSETHGLMVSGDFAGTVDGGASGEVWPLEMETAKAVTSLVASDVGITGDGPSTWCST